jgi:hypothetical protein
MQGCKDARMQGCKDARMQGCKDARMQGCKDESRNLRSFILVCFCLISFGNVFSQNYCNSVGYYIETEGFECGQSEGAVVLISDDTWRIPGVCRNTGFYMTVEFPTQEFQVTNSGQWVVLSSNPVGTTVLRYDFSWITETEFRAPFYGISSSPNTVFQFKQHAPVTGQVVNTNDFPLTSPIVVGSAVGILTLTSAIVNGKLLAVNPASLKGQRFRVEGEFRVNVNYSFSSSPFAQNNSVRTQIVMGPGAKIVQSARNVTMHYATVKGCNGSRWDRIHLVGTNSKLSCRNTTILDANCAIEMNDKTFFDFFHLNMRNNTIGIGSFGTNQKTIGITYAPGGFRWSYINDGQHGMYFENVLFVDLPYRMGISNQTTAGIECRNTSLAVNDILFFNNENGIFVSRPSNSLKSTKCIYGNNNIGIQTVGNRTMNVIENEFNFCNYYGIFKYSSDLGEQSTIMNNEFWGGFTGIDARVTASNALVYQNRMRDHFINSSLGGLPPGDHDWVYEDNSFSGSFINAYLYNTTGATYKNNPTFENASPSIQILLGSDNNIVGNQVQAKGVGIYHHDSPNLNLSSNRTEGGIGYNIQGNGSGSNIFCNEFVQGPGFNMVYGSEIAPFAVTGTQIFKGNTFDPSGVRAKHYSPDDDEVSRSRYFISSNNTVQGSEKWPFTESSLPDWFRALPIQDNECRIADDGKAERLTKTVDDLIEGLNAGIFSNYGLEPEYNAKLRLFRSLSKLQKLQPLNPLQETWFEDLETSSVKGFVQFEEELKNLAYPTEDEQLIFSELNEQIAAKDAEIPMVIWQTVDTLTDTRTIDTILLNQYYELNAERDDLNASFNNYYGDFRERVKLGIPLLRAFNQNIEISGTMSEHNLKTINNFLLDKLDTGLPIENSEGAMDIISLIANQCILEGGEAVGTARALMPSSTGSYTTYSDICPLEIGNSQFLKVKKSKEFHVFPNPTNSEAIVQIPVFNTDTSLEIMDLSGRSIKTVPIGANLNNVRLNTSDFPSGVYFIRMSGSDLLPLKLIVNH